MNQPPPCTYPIINKLAIGARPKVCGKGGGILTAVPYDGDQGQQLIPQMLCLPHSVEVAVWKWIQALPRKNFSREEIEFLLAEGCLADDLIEPQIVRNEEFQHIWEDVRYFSTTYHCNHCGEANKLNFSNLEDPFRANAGLSFAGSHRECQPRKTSKK